ncbi:sensor histidine kinase [Pseudoalteromonas sp. GB56]
MIVIFALLVLVVVADTWYQRAYPVQVPRSDLIELVEQLCLQRPCVSGFKLSKATVFDRESVHLGELLEIELKAGKTIPLQNDKGELYYYHQLTNGLILSLGPYSSEYQGQMYLYTLLFYLFVVIAILGGLYPLFREMDRLRKAAKQFGKTGNLSTLPTTTGRFFRPVNMAFEHMLKRLARLMALQKELSDTVSHEIRTPLSRIRFATEALNNNNLAYMKQEINIDLDEMESLVEEYLSFSRLENEAVVLDKQRQALLPIIEKQQQYFGAITEKKIALELLSSPLPDIEIDMRSFSRAIKNLIDNACKYARSRVCIRVALSESKQHILIHIEDDGLGIEEKDVDSLFLPYTQIQNKSLPGFGLGLAITQKIIFWHHGQISVSRSSLGGATFSITIPIHCDSDPAIMPT